MKDIRLDIKVRNNLILKRIEDAGFSSVHSFCKSHGLSYAQVVQFCSMKLSPLKIAAGRGPRVLTWRKSALALAEALGCLPEDLFSEATLKPLETNRASLEMDAAEAHALLYAPEETYLLPSHALDAEDLKSEIGKALGDLSPREAKVLRMRYGFEDGEEMTYEGIAQTMGVTRERIRQIESKALRKLRHPSRRKDLEPFTR